jgi:hypothetical protein
VYYLLFAGVGFFSIFSIHLADSSIISQLRLATLLIQASIETLLAFMHHFPLFALMLRVKDPQRLSGQFILHPTRSLHLYHLSTGGIYFTLKTLSSSASSSKKKSGHVAYLLLEVRANLIYSFLSYYFHRINLSICQLSSSSIVSNQSTYSPFLLLMLNQSNFGIASHGTTILSGCSIVSWQANTSLLYLDIRYGILRRDRRPQQGELIIE